MANATKIMVIRHAEKPTGSFQGVDIDGNSGDKDLIVHGWQRAGALARFFAPVTSSFQHPGIEQPGFLFASGPISKKDKKDGGDGSRSDRPEETITPLSQLIGVQIDLSFAEGEESQVAAAAIASGGVALIAWQHEDIPAIAQAILGSAIGIPPWPKTRFDVVWVFDLQTDGATYSFSQVVQLLLAGDLPTVIT